MILSDFINTIEVKITKRKIEEYIDDNYPALDELSVLLDLIRWLGKEEK